MLFYSLLFPKPVPAVAGDGVGSEDRSRKAQSMTHSAEDGTGKPVHDQPKGRFVPRLIV